MAINKGKNNNNNSDKRNLSFFMLVKDVWFLNYVEVNIVTLEFVFLSESEAW